MSTEVKRKVTEQYPYYYSREHTYYQNGKEVAKEIFNKAGNLIKVTGKIPDGKVTEYLPNGKKLGEWDYNGGLREGMGRTYYESGRPEAEITYKAGRREGPASVYYENGKIKSKCYYREGRLHDVFSYYSPEGKLLREDTYDNGVPASENPVPSARRDDEVTRTVTATHPMGRAREMSFFKKGNLLARIELDVKGNPLSLDGIIPDGIVREYYDSGLLMGEWTYKNNMLEGPATVYHENGTIETEMEFLAGKREGEVRVYFDNGMLQSIAHFKGGNCVSLKKFPG